MLNRSDPWTWGLCVLVWLAVTVAAPAYASEPIVLLNGAKPCSGAPSPAATRDEPVVVLQGLLCQRSHGHIARLPVGMRPARTLMFSRSNGPGIVRLAIDKEGFIKLREGPPPVNGRISLDGMAFSTRDAELVQLDAGFSHWERGYGKAQAYKHRDLVVLQGLVRAPLGKRRLGRLPRQLWPAERLMFQVDGSGVQVRVDLTPNGELYVETPRHGGGISLSGIAYPTRAGDELVPGNGVLQYGKPFGPMRARKAGPFVVLTGVATDASQSETLTTLPVGMRPRSTRVLSSHSGGDPVQLELAPDGDLTLAAGRAGELASWVTMSGMVFVPAPAQAGQPVDAAGSVARPPAQPPQPETPRSATAKQWADQLDGKLANLPGTGKIRKTLSSVANRLDGAGPYSATAQFEGGEATVVLYQPAGKPWPELAVVTPELSVGQLISRLEGTVADDFVLDGGAVVFVPQDNARWVGVNDLPTKIKSVLWHAPGGYHWRKVRLNKGANVFGKLKWRSTNTPDGLISVLDALGLCNDADQGTPCGSTLHLQARFGKAVTDACEDTQAWRVRVTRPGIWRGLIDGVSFRDSTVELVKEQSAYDENNQKTSPRTWQKVLRIWSPQVTIGEKDYFVFAQCVSTLCKVRNSLAVGAAKLNLADLENVFKVAWRNAGLPAWGAHGLPLDIFTLYHPNGGYQPSHSVNQDTGDPILSSANGYYVGDGQTIDAGNNKCVRGLQAFVSGRGELLKAPVGQTTVTYSREGGRSGYEAEGHIELAGLGLSPPLTEGSALSYDLSTGRGSDRLKLGAKIGFKGVGSRKVTLPVSAGGIDFGLPLGCPAPVDLTVKTGTDIRKASSWRIGVDFKPDVGCFIDAIGVAAAHVGEASLAMAELGGAGIGVVSEAIVQGWHTLGPAILSTAGSVGVTVSSGVQDTFKPVVNVGSNSASAVVDFIKGL